MSTPETFELFRSTFRGHPAGVAVITAIGSGGEPVGFTASSVASFSAEPPRVTVNAITTSRSWSDISRARRLAVNFLAGDQGELGARFAGPFAERFDGDHWSLVDGLPVIHGAKGRLVTEIVAIHPYETNAVLMLEIVGGANDPAREPLLYHDRRFLGVPVQQLAGSQ